MPEYTLRNVDPQLWSEFTERANRDGWPIRALVVSLLEGYARAEFNPTTPPPRELPQYAWLRAHYRQIAQEPDFADLDTAQQWERLVQQILNTPAGTLWQPLDEIAAAKRVEILRWLQRTSNLSLKHILTLRAIAHIGQGPDLRTNRRAFQYEVLGLPPGHQAWIADFDGGWRILRVVQGEQGYWGDPHLTKEDAVNSLAETLTAEGRFGRST